MARRKSEKFEYFTDLPDEGSWASAAQLLEGKVTIFDDDYRMGIIEVLKSPGPGNFYRHAYAVSTLTSRGLAPKGFAEAFEWDSQDGDRSLFRVSGEAEKRQLRNREIYPEWWEHGAPWTWFDEHGGSFEEFRKTAERVAEETRYYVVFPHFVVRDTTIAPILRKLLNNGMTSIQYKNLRRLLGM